MRVVDFPLFDARLRPSNRSRDPASVSPASPASRLFVHQLGESTRRRALADVRETAVRPALPLRPHVDEMFRDSSLLPFQRCLPPLRWVQSSRRPQSGRKAKPFSERILAIHDRKGPGDGPGTMREIERSSSDSSAGEGGATSSLRSPTRRSISSSIRS